MSDLGEALVSSRKGGEGCAIGMFQLKGMVFKQFTLGEGIKRVWVPGN